MSDVIERASKLASEGKLDEAIKVYEEALKKSRDPSIMNNLANLYRIKGLVASAIQLYEEALKIDPSFKEAKLNLAVAYIEIGRHAEAIMILESLLKGGYETDELYLALAVAYEKSRRLADFIRAYSRVKRPDKDEILREYGVNPPR